MKQFFPGCVLDLNKVPRTNSVTLGIRTSSATDYHRPVNTGFGLTQVLPVVVAALSARREDLLLIENPAVHLHPAGQARMGRFLAEVAAAEVQVLVETHSDHVLNGIRRAVKDNTLPSEDVKLHFFRSRSSDPDADEPQVESPDIDANGNLDRWPDGFFDQFDKDMNYFAGVGVIWIFCLTISQFTSNFMTSTRFTKPLSGLIKMRAAAKRFDREVYCNSNLVNTSPGRNFSMQQAVNRLQDKNKRRAIMLWLTKSSFWDAPGTT